MPIFAMLNGNTVENIVIADDKEATEATLRCTLIEIIDSNPAGIGYTYDAETNTFIQPAPTE